MTQKYQQFITSIEVFINKYYQNLLIRGGIIFAAFSLLLFLIIAVFETIGWFNSSVRLFLLLFFLTTTLFIFAYYLLLPLLRLFKLLPRITHHYANILLVKAFPEISDQIINILELKSLSTSHNADLIEASILQKIDKLSPYNFNLAIDYRRNKPVFLYFLAVVGCFLIVLFSKPSLIIDSSSRIIHYNKQFEKNVGYQVLLADTTLVVEKGKDLKVNFLVNGPVLPADLYIKFGSNTYLLPPIVNGSFSYTFKAINQNFSFYIFNSEYRTGAFQIRVINAPLLHNFSVQLQYPLYINRETESFNNLNEFNVPVGTVLTYQLKTYDADQLEFCGDTLECLPFKPVLGVYSFAHTFTAIHSTNYRIKATNQHFSSTVLTGRVTVLPDFYPGITIEKVMDKQSSNVIHFKGFITDDYGFSSLTFHANQSSVVLPIQKSLNQQEFYYSYEFKGTEGDEFTYFFEVFDNDGVNGPKATRSETYIYSIPQFSDILQQQQEANKALEEKLDKGLLMAHHLQRDIEQIQKSLLQENLSDYERKSQMEQLVQKNKELENLLSELSRDNLNKQSNTSLSDQQKQELLDKQKALQEMFDNMMTDELKDLLKQIEELQKNFNQQEFNQLSKDLKLNYEHLAKDIDRNMELLKRYNIESGVYEISNQLETLSKQQDSLARSNLLSNTELSQNELSQIQQELSLLQQTYDSLLNLNKTHDKPMELSEFNQEFNQIQDLMGKTQKELEQQNSDAVKSAEQGAKKMKQLSEDMSNSMQKNSSQQEGENADNLRVLLENFFYISFTQESIIEKFVGLNTSDPLFAALAVDQNKLLGSFTAIRDSLYALSKRTMQVGSHISSTAFTIETNLIAANEALLQQNFNRLNITQRTVLEKSNDLILLLSESLQNMDNMGQGSGSSNKKQKKPKKGQPSLSEMRKSQENMKQQLERMLNDMKNSQNQGGSQQGEQLARMLAEQEMFQQMLNDMLNGQSGVGKDTEQQLREIQRLIDQNRRDIINKSVSQSTLMRQNQIVTRLLDSEKSEQQRDLDNKRESKTANKYTNSPINNLFDEPTESIIFNELFYQNNLLLQPYYKVKYQKYLNEINNFENE